MNQQQPRAGNKQNRNRRRRPKTADLWRPVAEPDAPEPIRHAGDPATMLRSLGDPPLQAHSITAGHYLAAVVEKAAGLAVALAATADLLVDDRDAEAEADLDDADDADDDRGDDADGEGVGEGVGNQG